MREGSGGAITVDHGWDMPEGVREGLAEIVNEEKVEGDREGLEEMGPFISKRLGIQDRKYPSTQFEVSPRSDNC